MTKPTAEARNLVACLTPPGTGAIATLAITGPQAWEIVRRLFHPYSRTFPNGATLPEPSRFWLGRLKEGPQAGLADEIVLAVKPGLPVPRVELHCHGGAEVVRWLLEIFENHGLQVCSWQELERSGGEDPIKVLAQEALAQAPTTRTAAILLDQYHGAFRRPVEGILSALHQEDMAKAEQMLQGLAHYSAVGRRLTTPWRVAVLGAPNVGKSSLVNALAGYQRSIVAATPGTTRDVVTTLIAVDGWPVELLDTAGLRGEVGPLEEEGIRCAREAAAMADLCLWVLDASSGPHWPNIPSDSVRLVLNKIDLPAAWDLHQAVGAVPISARTGAGLSDLCEALSRWLVPDPPKTGSAVPFTAGLCRGVEEALEVCRSGNVKEARRLVEGLGKAREEPSPPLGV